MPLHWTSSRDFWHAVAAGLVLLLLAAGPSQSLGQAVPEDTADVLRLSLPEALERAQTESFPVRTSKAQRRAAMAQKRQSLGVFFPRITATEQGVATTDPVNAHFTTIEEAA
jgi:hypothetical protein